MNWWTQGPPDGGSRWVVWWLGVALICVGLGWAAEGLWRGDMSRWQPAGLIIAGGIAAMVWQRHE